MVIGKDAQKHTGTIAVVVGRLPSYMPEKEYLGSTKAKVNYVLPPSGQKCSTFTPQCNAIINKKQDLWCTALDVSSIDRKVC